MLKYEKLKFKEEVIRIYSDSEGNENTLGFIEYKEEICDRPKKLIKAIQFF